MHPCWIKVNFPKTKILLTPIFWMVVHITFTMMTNSTNHYVIVCTPDALRDTAAATNILSCQFCGLSFTITELILSLSMPTALQTKPNAQHHHHHPFLGCNLCVLWNGQAGLTWSCWSCSCCESWPYVGCWDHKLKPAEWQNRTFSLRPTENTHHSLNVGDYRAAMPAPCTWGHCC